MPKKVLFQLSLTLFAALLSATAVSAQTESCAVKIDVTRNNSEAKISGASATAVNSSTKKVYKSAVKAGMPYFRSLPEGEYRITVVRAGYMRSAVDFILSCASDEEPLNIELFRGSSAKTVRLNRVVYRDPPLRRAEANNYIIGGRNTEASPRNDDAGAVGVGNEDIPPPVPPTPKVISGGVVNGKATNLVKPEYPAAARAVQASGAVNVQVTIDEQGNVISASAVSGHPLLRAAAVKAARESKFAPTRLSGQLVKVTGIIVYNFVP